MSEKFETSFIVNLSKAIEVPLKKRARSAVKLLRKAVEKSIAKKYNVERIVVDERLNEELWKRSASKPPRRIRVKVKVEGDIARISLEEEKT